VRLRMHVPFANTRVGRARCSVARSTDKQHTLSHFGSGVFEHFERLALRHDAVRGGRSPVLQRRALVGMAGLEVAHQRLVLVVLALEQLPLVGPQVRDTLGKLSYLICGAHFEPGDCRPPTSVVGGDPVVA